MPIKFNPALCAGAWECLGVCPMNVFEKNEKTNKVDLPRIDDCIECGACAGVCPEGALAL